MKASITCEKCNLTHIINVTPPEKEPAEEGIDVLANLLMLDWICDCGEENTSGIEY